MSRSYTPVGPAKDQPILRRRRRRSKPTVTQLERLQRDFWRYFDLEKFGNDWRAGVGKNAPAV